MQTLNAFFEGVGVLVKKRLIDIELVEDLLSQRILWYWEKTKPIATVIRRELNDPTQLDSVEYLYNQMKQRQPVSQET